MPNPNPYESPQSEGRTSTPRRIAVGATLVLLSIPAASIAGFGTCMAASEVVRRGGYDSLFFAPIGVGLLIAVFGYLLAAWLLEGRPRIEAKLLNSRRFWHCFWTLALATPCALVLGGGMIGLAMVIEINNGPHSTIPDWLFVVIGTSTYAACLIALHLARKWKLNGENKP